MGTLEILLLSLALIFLVLVIMRGDRVLNAKRDAAVKRRNYNRKSPKP